MFIFRCVMCLYFRPLRTRFVERWFDDWCVSVIYLGYRVVVPYFGIDFSCYISMSDSVLATDYIGCIYQVRYYVGLHLSLV